MAMIAGSIFMFSEFDTPPEINPPSQNQTAESQMPATFQESRDKTADSESNEPEINIMSGNGSPPIRIEGELISTIAGMNMAAKISERERRLQATG